MADYVLAVQSCAAESLAEVACLTVHAEGVKAQPVQSCQSVVHELQRMHLGDEIDRTLCPEAAEMHHSDQSCCC